MSESLASVWRRYSYPTTESTLCLHILRLLWRGLLCLGWRRLLCDHNMWRIVYMRRLLDVDYRRLCVSGVPVHLASDSIRDHDGPERRARRAVMPSPTV